MTFQRSILAAVAAVLLALPAAAQQATELDLTRDAVDFDGLMTRPVDPVVYDTALVLTSADGNERLVVCKAYDEWGTMAGRGHVVAHHLHPFRHST